MRRSCRRDGCALDGGESRYIPPSAESLPSRSRSRRAARAKRRKVKTSVYGIGGPRLAARRLFHHCHMSPLIFFRNNDVSALPIRFVTPARVRDAAGGPAA